MKKLCFILTVALLVSAASCAWADVKPNPLFSDGAVLQQGIRLPVWGTAGNGEKITVRFQGQTVETVAHGGKWRADLKPLKSGGPFTMTISGENNVEINNLLVGEVWVCSGQSNMQMELSRTANADAVIAASKDPQLRLFTVPLKVAGSPLSEAEANWVESGPDTTAGFSAVGYYFGRDLRKALNVPVGLINTSWGGTPAQSWTSASALEAEPTLRYYLRDFDAVLKAYPEAMKASHTAASKNKEAPKEPANPFKTPYRPASLYNAMIAPLIPYGIKGAIWYQGESNAGNAYEYRTLFPAMIKSWRDAWKEGNFPFLFVQLAPFQAIVSEPMESAWAELREAQLLTTKVSPNTAMAVITDYGDPADIHPKQKEPVGARLALAARAMAYGQKVAYIGPSFSSMRVEGGKAILSFKNVDGGLVAKGGELTGFAIAGPDRKFVNAKAEIAGGKVVVSSPEVAKPDAVRFGWANCPVVNLFNEAGLPASPFRTDNYPMLTKPK